MVDTHPSPLSRALTILYATETGNVWVLAERAAALAADHHLPARLIDMATCNTLRFHEERDLLVLTSTHGEGDPPSTAIDFFDFLDETDLDLSQTRFAVMALGDSGYDEFCAAGRRLDHRLAALGATRLAPCIEVDVDDLRIAPDWLADLLAHFVPATAAAA